MALPHENAVEERLFSEKEMVEVKNKPNAFSVILIPLTESCDQIIFCITAVKKGLIWCWIKTPDVSDSKVSAMGCFTTRKGRQIAFVDWA